MLARRFFAVQATAGACWWVAVVASDDVRRLTLGEWDPGVLVGPDVLLYVGGSALAAATGGVRWAVVTTAWTLAVTAALVGYGLVGREAGWGALLMTGSAAGSLAATLVLERGHLPSAWFFAGPFRFRPAPERSAASNLAHSLAQLVVFWSVLLVALPFAGARVEDRLRLDWPALDAPGWNSAGAVTFAVASALGLWACASMAIQGGGTPLPAATGRHLVVVGPYRWVRNPMATAGALQTTGAGLVLGSWLVVVAAAVGAVLWHTLIRPAEEADLVHRFGSAYERYRSQVRCWVPRFGMA